MMRTPAKKNGSEARGRVLRNLGSTITIAGSPKTQVRSTRTFSRAASSSEQMAAILYEKPKNPAPYFPNRLVDGKENVTPNLNLSKRNQSTKLNNNSSVNLNRLDESTKLIDNFWVNPLDESAVGDFSAEFFNWLRKTEKDSNAADFAKLRKDLSQLVGRYTLECSKKEK